VSIIWPSLFCKHLLCRTPEKKAEPRVDWVSSSSAYKKEEIDQPGAPRAKKITKVNNIIMITTIIVIV